MTRDALGGKSLALLKDIRERALGDDGDHNGTVPRPEDQEGAISAP